MLVRVRLLHLQAQTIHPNLSVSCLSDLSTGRLFVGWEPDDYLEGKRKNPQFLVLVDGARLSLVLLQMTAITSKVGNALGMGWG